MSQEDPGWWPSLRVLRWRKETNSLVGLRSLFLLLLVSLFLFVFALSFIAPWDGGTEGWVPWVVSALGICVLAAVVWFRRQPLATGSPEALAASYRARFFIGVGLAESAALFGFCGVFIGGSVWIYVLGLAFALVGLWTIAPTQMDIERRQREITAVGSPLSLLDALTSVSGL